MEDDEEELEYERKIRDMNRMLRDQIRTENHSRIDEVDESETTT